MSELEDRVEGLKREPNADMDSGSGDTPAGDAPHPALTLTPELEPSHPTDDDEGLGSNITAVTPKPLSRPASGAATTCPTTTTTTSSSPAAARRAKQEGGKATRSKTRIGSGGGERTKAKAKRAPAAKAAAARSPGGQRRAARAQTKTTPRKQAKQARQPAGSPSLGRRGASNSGQKRLRPKPPLPGVGRGRDAGGRTQSPHRPARPSRRSESAKVTPRRRASAGVRLPASPRCRPKSTPTKLGFRRLPSVGQTLALAAEDDGEAGS